MITLSTHLKLFRLSFGCIYAMKQQISNYHFAFYMTFKHEASNKLHYFIVELLFRIGLYRIFCFINKN